MEETELARQIRLDILRGALSAGKIGAHIASSLSMVEIMIAILKNCKNSDLFILSKGHGGLGYYAAMHQMGMISDAQFASFESDGGDFPGQPSRSKTNGIIYSSGSLGMGLSYAAGRAYANRGGMVYVLLGDGELNEGSVWEGVSLSKKLELSNLIAVVDCNGLQSDGNCEDVLGMDYGKIWSAYGWNVQICNGHEVKEIEECISKHDLETPTVVLAKTTKGKGVSFMENDNSWHHNILREDKYNDAVREIGEAYGL